MAVFGLLVTVGVILAAMFVMGRLARRRSKAGQNLPPMPPRSWFPILGHLAAMDPKAPHVTVTNWGKAVKTGVMRLFFGGDEVFVLNDLATIKEAFTKNGDTFHGRPNIWLLKAMGDQKGIILADGSRWREQRRFSLHRLRDLGFGKSMIETKIKAEIKTMCEFIDAGIERNEQSVDAVKQVQYCVANIITSIVYGFSFPRGDENFEEFQHQMSESMRIIGLAGILMFFPWVRYIVPGGLGYWRLMKYKDRIFRYHRQQIRRQFEAVERDRRNGDQIEDTDNFVRAFYKESLKRKEAGEEGHYFDEEQLMITVGDLFFAGQETTVTTIKWALLFMCHNPGVQQKMYQEMIGKIGQEPSLSDRVNLPYCHAAVIESQRRGNIIPFGVWHSSIKDATLAGYHIPAGSTIIPNISSVMMDDDLFPEPDKFKPERFLDADGHLIQKREGVIPFSLGKRECLGESLALAELFLILTNLVWHYEFTFEQGNLETPLTPVIGTTTSTLPFKLKMSKRVHHAPP